MSPGESAAAQILSLPEVATSASERQVRFLADLFPQLIAIAHADGAYRWVNRRWLEFTGLLSEAAHGNGWLAVIHPQERDPLAARLQELLRTGAPFDLEYRLRGTDGDYHRVRTHSEPMPGMPDGTVEWVHTSTLLVETEATSQFPVAAEQPENTAARSILPREPATNTSSIEDHEALFRATFENAAVGIAHVAPDGRWLRVNRRLCEITGYSLPELLSRTFADITHPEDLEADWALARTLLDGQISTYDIEKRYLRPDGSALWVEVTVSLQRREDGQPGFFISVIQDISARKSAEQALRESEEFVRSVFESSTDCIKILDLDGRLQEMNGPGRCVMEIDDFDVIRGRNWLEFWTGSAAEGARTAFEDARAGRNGRFQGLCPTYKGAPRYWDVTVTPIGGLTGAPLRLLCVSRDITAQRASAEAFRLTTERFRTALKSSPVVVFNLDQDLRYTWLENAPPGLELAEVVGKTNGDLLECAEEATEIDALMRQVLNSGQGQRREIRLTVGGVGLFFDITVDPYHDSGGAVVGVTCAAVNVTEWRNTEAALRDREHFLHRVTEITPGVLHVFDLDEQRNVFINGQVYSALGYRPEEIHEFAGSVIARLLHPDDRAQFEEHTGCLRTLQDGETAEQEFRMRDREGNWHWFQSTDTVFLRNHDGSVRQVIGAALEITANKRAEEALRESEDSLRLGVTVGGLALAEIDYLTRMVRLSAEAARLFGLGDGESTVPLAEVHATFHPDDQADLHRLIAASHDPNGIGSMSLDHRVVRPDGEMRWLSVRKQVFFDGSPGHERPVRGILAALDITDRKLLDEKLRQSEARLRRIFDANLIGLLYAHLDGRFLSANDKFLDLVGYTRAELEAGLIDARRLTPPEYLEVSWRAQRQLRQHGAAPLYEKEYLRKDGTRVPVLIGTTMLEDAGDVVVAFVLDLTQLKQTEAELAAANTHLATALKRERNIAVALQQSLTQMPEQDAFPGYQVHAVYEPAWEEADVGGDFVDAFLLDDHRMAVVVGDVSGKGLRAAARTAEVRYSLRGMLHERRSPAAALNGLNEYFCDARRRGNESADEFICLTVAVVEFATGKILLSTAGSEPPLYVRNRGAAEESQVRGTPIGVFAGMEYREEENVLASGELLVLTTDGITEARRGGEFFGYEGFTRAITERRAVAALTELAEGVVAEAREFAGGALHDDTCLLLVRRL